MLLTNLIYALEDQENTNTYVSHLTRTLENIVTLEVNHFKIVNVNMAFVKLSANRNIDLQLNKLHLTTNNLRNITEKKDLIKNKDILIN